jgi:hypothetical protein
MASYRAMPGSSTRKPLSARALELDAVDLDDLVKRQELGVGGHVPGE